MQSGLCSLVNACQRNIIIHGFDEIVIDELMTIDLP